MIILFFTIIIISIAGKVNAMTIVLDPGHGGIDSGATYGNLYERDVNLKIANYLKDYLNEYYGVKVIMTHTGFSGSSLHLFDRAMVARKNNADLFVSLHINSVSNSSSTNGAEVYVTADKSCEKYNKKMTSLGNKVLNNLNKLGIANKGVKTRQISGVDPTDKYNSGTLADYYGIIRYAMRGTAIDYGVTQKIVNGEKIPVDASMSADVKNGEGISTILIEHCYISNANDRKFISSNTNIQKLAKADADAIVAEYGLKTKEVVAAEEAEKKRQEGLIAKSVTINEKETVMLEGEKRTITANILPLTVENRAVTWSSSDENVVKIDENGVITAVGEGTATIKVVTDNQKLTATSTVIVNKLDENQSVEIVNLGIEDGYMHKLEQGSTIAQIKENISVSDDLEISIKYNNEDISEDEIVRTGIEISIIEKESNNVLSKYYYVLKGDVDGNGKVSALDYAKIKNHIMQNEFITKEANIQAADVNSNGSVTALDYAKIKNYIMSGIKINF